MRKPRVLIVDFSAHARERPCGRSIAAVLPDHVDIEIVRLNTRRAWANEALARSTHVILSGCDLPDPRARPWFEPSRRQVRRIIARGMPVLGLCFGHQFIIQALGGVDMVRTARYPEHGITRLRPTAAAAHDPVLSALPLSELTLYNLHSEDVAAELAVPALGLEVLAASDRCAVHAYRLPGRPVWGLQAHPEFDREVMRATLPHHPATDDETVAGLSALERDVDTHPSCQRPELFDAFVRVRSHGTRLWGRQVDTVAAPSRRRRSAA